MSALAEALAEVERLETIDADVGLGDNGKANLEKARTAVESEKRQERRDRASARQTLANKLSAHDAILNAAYQSLKEFVEARRELDRARAETAAAEHFARAVGVEVPRSFRAVDSEFFDSPAWRAFDFELRPLLGSGKILG
jgi:methylphosphotriester-DNA--protein-cysteine methyltransferase